MISFSIANFFLKDTHLLFFFGDHFSVPAVLVVARATTAQDIKFTESIFHLPFNVKNHFMEK